MIIGCRCSTAAAVSGKGEERRARNRFVVVEDDIALAAADTGVIEDLRKGVGRRCRRDILDAADDQRRGSTRLVGRSRKSDPASEQRRAAALAEAAAGRNIPLMKAF